MDIATIAASESGEPPPPIGGSQPFIEDQLRLLEAMILPNGAVLASPNGHYKAHWVRDGLYVLTAASYLGLNDLAHKLIRAPFSIFHKHRAKIQAGIRRKPGTNYEFLHARYHPAHFDEFKDEWGHNQLDMIGLFLYLVANLPPRGTDVFQCGRHYEDKILLNHITRYLETLGWWRCPDFGVWEEGPKKNASSIGAVLAGLRSLAALEDHDLFFNESQLRKGQEALDKLLPDESEERDCDLAQLSLIWPFGVLREDQAETVLERIEERLVRERGVIRYRGDAYFNAADDRLITIPDSGDRSEFVDYRDEHRRSYPFPREGTEAQWPLGLAWLSIVYSKLAKARVGRGEDHAVFAEKAGAYLDRLKACRIPVGEAGVMCVPELFVGGTPNINTPLTWATSFSIVAAVAHSEIEDRNVPDSVF